MYETEEGYVNIPFDMPFYALSDDGQELPLRRQDDAILLPTEDGFEAVALEDFSVVMIGGQLMLFTEVNPVWLIPIKTAVIAALKMAGVTITTASLYVAGKLMLAGVAITAATVAAGKALKNAGIAITQSAVTAAKALISAGRSVTRSAVDMVIRAMLIIEQKFVIAGVAATAQVMVSAIVDWLNGFCIMPWCSQPARQRASFNPSLMHCDYYPFHPCFPW